MALAHAILVSLLDAPRSGYDIAKEFDQSVGFFWKASHQQIYRELGKLDRGGLLLSQTIEQTGKPNRIEYRLTEAGENALAEWVAASSEPASVKEDLLVKMFAAGRVATADLLADVRRRREFFEALLELYRRIERRHYADPSRLDARMRGRYLGLSAGLRHARMWIEWCDEATRLLEEAAD